MLIEGDPFTLIEGMVIAGHAVGACEGYVYIRSEYPDAIEALDAAISVAEGLGWLGYDVLGSGVAFHLHVRVGAAPTSVARRRRCSRVSRVVVAWCG